MFAQLAAALRPRITRLEVAILLYCWLNGHSMVAAQWNVTIDDIDPSIVYSPADAWYSTSENCTVCLSPSVINSYHEGLHLLPPYPNAVASAPSLSQPTGVPKAADDVGLGDLEVTLKYDFSGSAVYLFGIQPLAASNSTMAPTTMNLSFTLDQTSYPNFVSTGTQGGTGFRSNVSVFKEEGLTEGPHALTVEIGLGSAFLFDYLVYTTTNSTNNASAPIEQTQAASSARPKNNNNIATFGGAVGGSVGVLALLFLGLAFSIIRRRKKSALRDSLERSLRPEMIGPSNFVERFFPHDPMDQTQTEIVVPSVPPPTYGAALSSPTTGASTPFSSNLGPHSLHAPSRTLSYADIPPASLPPTPSLDQLPPPFSGGNTPSDSIMAPGAALPLFHNSNFVEGDVISGDAGSHIVPLMRQSGSNSRTSSQVTPPPK